MAWTSIVIAVGVIVFVVARRVRGEAVPAPKKLFLLPLVVGAIGLQTLTHAKPNAVAIGVIAAGGVVSLALGLLRGRLDKISVVNGVPSMAWTAGSVAVFVVNVLFKLALDAGGVAAGGTRSALTASILLSLGLTLFGEAVVVWQRAQSLPSEDVAGGRYRSGVPQPGRPTIWPPTR
jgi:hypothetical protein